MNNEDFIPIGDLQEAEDKGKKEINKERNKEIASRVVKVINATGETLFGLLKKYIPIIFKAMGKYTPIVLEKLWYFLKT